MGTSKQIGVEVIEPGRAVTPDDESGDQALLARIPLLSGDSRQAQYLSWRAQGFAVREACDLTPCTHGTLMRWRRENPDFADFETKCLRELQKELSKDLLYMDFARNMRLALFRDFKVLFKAAYDLESLTEAEKAHLRLIRRMYTPQDLVVLEKAVAPGGEGSGKGDVSVNTLIIQIDGRQVESEEAKRAAAKQLMRQFLVQPEEAAPEAGVEVEGEVVGAE